MIQPTPSRPFRFSIPAVAVLTAILASGAAAAAKDAGVIYSENLRENAIANARAHEWARDIQSRIVERARPWLEAPDVELWNSVFGPAVTRSWMVWSDGVCPNCGNDVKMYNWEIDIWKHPFKVRCPHCEMLFPTNDFEAYRRSGLDGRGWFDPARADRSLLYNEAHPGADDPLRGFGVDGGEGYTEGDKRWRFIGYYLIAGQWRQKIVGGIERLSEAYFATGEPAYARKAAILLDRVADIYPEFDFETQGLVYERGGHRGYVTVWHDACEEVRELAQGYDRIFDAMEGDSEFVAFLSNKAREYGLSNPKTGAAMIRENIEQNILRHTLEHRGRIESNFPRTPAAVLTIEAVLGWPGNRERVMDLFAQLLEDSLREDGMTGEKGLSGYSTIFPRAFAELAARFDRLDPTILEDLMRRFPDLRKTYRFHIDTWCLDRFYPREGDCGWFGSPSPRYAGASFVHPAHNAEPSMFTFFSRLYQLTGDADFIRVLHRENGGSVDSLPHDICADDPAAFQAEVRTVIENEGGEIELDDVQLNEWGLSILRSGEGEHRRAAWLDHDAGGRHSHRDGLNLGLFAKGMDLLPDFGYPPVGYGGWGAPKAVWYTQTAAHNTVMVDGRDHNAADGKSTLWGGGDRADWVRVSAPGLTGGERFERMVALVDVSEEDFYLIDLFDVAGGSEHIQFFSSNLGTVSTGGLRLTKPVEYEYKGELRGFAGDPQPAPGWYADWALDNAEGGGIHLRYTGLTRGAAAALGECWVELSSEFGGKGAWIPRLMIRRRADQGPLASRFAGILQPYEDRPFIENAAARLSEDSAVFTVDLADGRRQWFATRSGDGNREYSDGELRWNAEVAFVSVSEGQVEYWAVSNGAFLQYGDRVLLKTDETPAVGE